MKGTDYSQIFGNMVNDYQLFDTQAYGTNIYASGRKVDGTKFNYCIKDFRPYFYVPTTEPYYHVPFYPLNRCTKVSTDKVRDMKFEREKYKYSYEADIRYDIRFHTDTMINYTSSPLVTPRVWMFDIEVFRNFESGRPNAKCKEHVLNALSFHDNYLDEVFTIFVVDSRYHKIDTGIRKEGKHNVIFVSSERDLYIVLSKLLKKFNPDIISGWNCVSSGEYVWLKDKIVVIDDVNDGDCLYKHGSVNRQWYTGEKIGYNIELVHGFNITTSDKHVFPYWYKEKSAYKNKNTLLKNCSENDVENISKKLETHDVYLKVEKHENVNDDYTYKKYLLDNIEYLLEYEWFDILITDFNVIKRLRMIPEFRENLKHDAYWSGINFYKRAGDNVAYKKLKKYVTLEDLKNQIKNNDRLSFSINRNHLFDVDINGILEYDFIRLLGFEFTDGCMSKNETTGYNHSFTSIYSEICEYYCSIISTLKKHKQKYYQIRREKSKSFKFGYINKYMLLIPFIYGVNNKKCLNVEMLSRFSNNQFCRFFEGLIDGDGVAMKTKKSLGICNFNGDDKKIQQLLLWNGVFAYRNNNNVTIVNTENNSNFLKSLNIIHPKRKTVYLEKSEIKNSISNNIRKFEYSKFFLLRIESIKKTETLKMFDLNTASGYFNCNGILTHNCNNFDIPFLCEKGLSFYKDVTKFLSPFNIEPHMQQNMSEKIDEWFIKGYAMMDYMLLYKKQQKRENYSLDFISNTELGYGKIEYDGSLDELYRDDYIKFIEYSKQDVSLLNDLENHLMYIMLVNEMKEISASPLIYFNYSNTTKIVDSLICKHIRLLPEPLVMKSKPYDNAGGKKFSGAYVKNPIVGFHNWIIDEDATGMYPSIMRTLNISPETFMCKIIATPEEISEQIRPYMFKGKNNISIKDVKISTNIGIQKTIEVGKLKSMLLKNSNGEFTIAINGSVYASSKLGIIPAIQEMLSSGRSNIKKYEKLWDYTREYCNKLMVENNDNAQI